jgi:tRNA threonylcarbamoyladenosine biosynthesis protein TsaE
MPILNEHSLDLISHSPEQTGRFGERLGALLRAGDVICLEGELGTGKTCLTQGIGQGMGIVAPITSPTFILIAEHHPLTRGATLFHIDLYRLEAAVDEALDFGLDEYLGGDGVCVIEWADRVLPALPDERLWVVLRHLDTSKRGIVMKAHGDRYDQVLEEFRHHTFGV